MLKVIRNRVTPRGDWASPFRSCGAATMTPECTLSVVELITACRAPSTSTVTLAEGGMGFAGSIPNVMVCGVTGSELELFYHIATNEFDPARTDKLNGDKCVNRVIHVHKGQ